MNIIKKLNANNISSQIRYYGINDMATGFEVKILIENKDAILEYFKTCKFYVNSIDDYIDYLYLSCVINYEEIIPNVRDDIKDTFSNIIEQLKKYYKKYNQKDLAIFIREKYKDIFENKYEEKFIEHDVVDYTIELLIRYSPNDLNAINYIITNYSFKVYDDFDTFKKIFDKDQSLSYYKLLLSKELITKDSNYRLEKIKTVLESLKKKDEQLYSEKINLLISIYKENYFNSTVDTVISTHHEIKKMVAVLKGLAHKSAYEFEKELIKQEKTLDEYLKQHGKSTEFEISIKPIVEMYENSSKEWFQKSLMITHSPNKTSKKTLITNLEYSIKYYARSQLLDYCVSTNIAIDKVFTYSVINNLSLVMLQGKYAIRYMILDENRLNDLLAYIFAGVDAYFGKESLYYNTKDFEFDLDMLYNSLLLYNEATMNKDELKEKWLIYSVENLLCGIIEKTLRNVYYEKTKKDKYTSSAHIKINNIVSSEEVRNEIGQELCDCLDYYLLNRNGIGKNNRNDFCHYNESIYDKLICDTFLEELYLLLTISNSLLLLNYRKSKNNC